MTSIHKISQPSFVEAYDTDCYIGRTGDNCYFESESAPRDCDIATANSSAEYLILRPQFINFSATLRLNHMILNPKQTQLVLVRLKARLFRILLFQPFFSLLD